MCFWGQFCASSKRSSTILDFFPSGFSKLCPAEVLTLHISGGKVGFRWSVVKKDSSLLQGPNFIFQQKTCQVIWISKTFFFGLNGLHARKLTWHWKNNRLKMYLLPNMVMFHCHLSFRGCNRNQTKAAVFFSGNQSRPPVVCWSKKQKHWAEVRVEYHAGDSWIRTKSTKHVMSSWCMTGILGGGLDPISNVCQWMHLILLWNRIETNGCCQLIIDFCEWFSDFDECFSWWHFTPLLKQWRLLCVQVVKKQHDKNYGIHGTSMIFGYHHRSTKCALS